jgi:radical SAM protein with 4Fe4S-binding SPASM domain
MTTSVVPTTPITALRTRLGLQARADRVPVWAHIEIIATCNFKCQHCFIAPCAEREDVMSLEEAEHIFDKMAEAGTLSVLLTGGEIFTHKQFKEIYLSAKRHGFLMYLNTNGYLLGERWADFLAEWPPAWVSISLYGLTNEKYEEVTGIPRSFDRVKNALDLLAARGIPHEIKCPAMTLTVDDIFEMRTFAESRGIQFRYDAIMTPQEDGDMKPINLQLAPKRVVDLDEQFDPGFTDFKEFAGPRIEPNDGSVYKCGAGKNSLHIDVHGNVTTCLSSRQSVGNLLQQPFEEVWEALGGKVSRKFPEGHPCATCQFRKVCAGCPATVEQVTGLPEGYVQQYCKMTHLKAYRAGYHPTGVPRTVTEGIPSHVRTPLSAAARALPVLF